MAGMGEVAEGAARTFEEFTGVCRCVSQLGMRGQVCREECAGEHREECAGRSAWGIPSVHSFSRNTILGLSRTTLQLSCFEISSRSRNLSPPINPIPISGEADILFPKRNNPVRQPVALETPHVLHRHCAQHISLSSLPSVASFYFCRGSGYQ